MSPVSKAEVVAHWFCFAELYNVTILLPSGQRSDIWIGHSDSKVQKETPKNRNARGWGCSESTGGQVCDTKHRFRCW